MILHEKYILSIDFFFCFFSISSIELFTKIREEMMNR